MCMFVPIILVKELRLGKGDSPGEGHTRSQAELPSPCSHSCFVIMALRTSMYLAFFYHSGEIR